MTLDSFIKNVRNLNAKDLILKAAALRVEELADLNVEQMEQGLLSTGGNISPNYETEAYSQYKKSIGSKSSPTPDLKLTGDFHDGVFSKVSGDNIIFGSTDEKSSKLQLHYTKDIFGVTTGGLIETIDSDVVSIMDKEMTK